MTPPGLSTNRVARQSSQRMQGVSPSPPQRPPEQPPKRSTPTELHF